MSATPLRISGFTWGYRSSTLRPYVMLIQAFDNPICILYFDEHELLDLMASLLSLVPWAQTETCGPQTWHGTGRRLLRTSSKKIALSYWLHPAQDFVTDILLDSADFPLLATAILEELLEDRRGC